MSVLSDSIEDFIKALLTEEEPQVEVRRNELAEYFHCAPSQINYVLTTRFCPDRGYYTVSRRGGGGYIRIVRVEHKDSDDYLMHLAYQRVGESLTMADGLNLVGAMADRKIITGREAALMAAAINDRGICIPLQNKDRIRAAIFKEMLAALIRQRGNENGNV